MPVHSLKNALVARAEKLARSEHAGQFRRDGVTPYVRHPASVAARVAGDPVSEAIAWLHDVLEDTGMTVEILRAKGMPEEVIAGVTALTKSKDVAYETYLLRIKSNPTAKKVKIADMLSNLSDQPTQKQIVKYAKGLLVLLG